MESDWTNIIRPKSGWLEINIRELWEYRDLIIVFVRRDFIAGYKQTILGPVWFLFQPIITTIVFTVVFGNIAKISTDGLPKPLFYLCGTVAWGYFAQCLTKTSNTFIGNAGIFGKVYFPRLTVPVSVVISKVLTFVIQFMLFVFLIVYFNVCKNVDIHINSTAFLTPVLLFMMAMLGLGLGVTISSLTTKYRDLTFLIGFGVQLLMYATPVIYPLSIIPDKYRTIILLNPMTTIIETFRYAYLGKGAFSWLNLIISGAIIFIIFFVGLLIFNRIEKTFMDTV